MLARDCEFVPVRASLQMNSFLERLYPQQAFIEFEEATCEFQKVDLVRWREFMCKSKFSWECVWVPKTISCF